MKQLYFQPRHRIRAVALLFFCMITLCNHSKAERPDSIGGLTKSDSLPSFMIPKEQIPEKMSIDPSYSETTNIISPQSYRYYSPNLSYNSPAINALQFKMPSTDIFSTETLSIYGSGSQQSILGLMGIESGRINAAAQFGPLTLTAWGGADKYGYFRGLQRSWTFGGTLMLTLSDRWSITMFGEYHSPIHPLTPAMAEMMKSSTFGGYASYNINDRWGVSVGAQATRSLVTNQWNAQPIVMPYYRINKSMSIGVDVGGILYNVAKDYIDSKKFNDVQRPAGAAPGGRPPVPTPPRFAPRR